LRRGPSLVAVGAVVLLLSSTPALVHAITTGQYSNLVIGQRTFTTLLSGTGQRSLTNPYDVAFDSSGNLWVSDANNSRVLEYKPPFSTGMLASLVLGQAKYVGLNPIVEEPPPPAQNNLAEPAGLAFDPSGNLWVADLLNSRVLEYKPPFSTGMNASLVIGQANFTSNVGKATQTTLYNPFGIAFDRSGNLWVADYLNSRVLEYSRPFSTGMGASLVVGQTNFTAGAQAASQTGLFDATGVSFDPSGNLWIADTGNSRVLEYKPPFSTGMPASIVVGESGFNTTIGVDPRTRLYYPISLGFDQAGNLWVADEINRILGYSPPFNIGMSTSVVIGQPDLRTLVPHLTQSSLRAPTGLAFDPSGNLWVADTFNSRILEYLGGATATMATDTKTTGGAASADHSAQTSMTVSVNGSSAPDGTAVNIFSADLSANPLSTPAGLARASFYDVSVTGMVDGTVRACISSPSADSATVVKYYSSGAWVNATGTSATAGSHVCGTIPISALAGGYLAVGEPTQPPTSPSAPVLLLALAAVVVVVLVGLVAFKLRPRKNNSNS